MTFLRRIKRLLANPTHVLALAALAIAAIPVQAAVIFSTGKCSVSATGGTSGGSCNEALLPFAPNGSTGVHLTGSVLSTSNTTSTYITNISWNGGTNAPPFDGITLPVFWDFTVAFTPASTIKSITDVKAAAGDYTWAVDIFFNGGDFQIHETGSGSGAFQEFTGSANFDLTGTITPGWNASVSVQENAPVVGDQIDLEVPGTSVDINSTVPEPGTLLLLAPGLGYILLRRRRR